MTFLEWLRRTDLRSVLGMRPVWILLAVATGVALPAMSLSWSFVAMVSYGSAVSLFERHLLRR